MVHQAACIAEFALKGRYFSHLFLDQLVHLLAEAFLEAPVLLSVLALQSLSQLLVLAHHAIFLLLSSGDLIAHTLNLALNVPELRFSRLELRLKLLDLPLELIYLGLKVRLLLPLLSQDFLVALLNLLDVPDMVLLLLGQLLIEVGVELSNELLMLLLQFLDLLCMLSPESFKLGLAS